MSRTHKRFIVLGACLALILLMAQGLGARGNRSPSTAGVSYLSELERKIYSLTNEVRRRQGAPTLTWETSLGDAARSHSADMLTRNYFSHVSPEGKTPHERILSSYRFALSMSGENIWSGTGHDYGETDHLARVIVNNWMSSAGHRKNLLNPEFTDIGVGVATRGKEIRVTQVFVRTQKSK